MSLASSLEDKIDLNLSAGKYLSTADQNQLPPKSDQLNSERKKVLEEQSKELNQILIEDKLETEVRTKAFVFGPLDTLLEKEPELFAGLEVDDLEVFGSKIFKSLSLQLSRIPLQQRYVPDAYKLGSGDRLRVHAWNESQDQTISVEVNQNGNIQFPLAGEVAVLGIQKQNLNEYLKKKLSKFL